jgi:hypothetical protein
MTEIRSIQASEADDFLRLLCDVFELDFDRARGIFFNEPMFDLRRKWALFEHGKMVSILTTVPLEFGWGNASGIAGVATRTDRRGEGLAGKLLDGVLESGRRNGEPGALLFARQTTVYERNGFKPIDRVIRAPILATREISIPRCMDGDEIARIYAAWAMAHPARLRRNVQRWAYWRWNLRVCSPLGGGYLCMEGNNVRECIVHEKVSDWPLPAGTEWLGLASMAEMIQIPLGETEEDLVLMGRNIPEQPQMFMTDQF